MEQVSSFNTHGRKQNHDLTNFSRSGCDEHDYVRWRNCLGRDFTINGLSFSLFKSLNVICFNFASLKKLFSEYIWFISLQVIANIFVTYWHVCFFPWKQFLLSLLPFSFQVNVQPIFEASLWLLRRHGGH